MFDCNGGEQPIETGTGELAMASTNPLPGMDVPINYELTPREIALVLMYGLDEVLLDLDFDISVDHVIQQLEELYPSKHVIEHYVTQTLMFNGNSAFDEIYVRSWFTTEAHVFGYNNEDFEKLLSALENHFNEM